MENVQYYYNLAIIMAVASAFMLVLTILIWIKLDIRRSFAVLSGSEAKRDIDQIRKDAASGNVQGDLRRKGAHAVISWNTSERLEKGGSSVGTVPLMGESDADKTVLLNPAGMADSDATVVLGASNIPATPNAPVSNPDFVIEREEYSK